MLFHSVVAGISLISVLNCVALARDVCQAAIQKRPLNANLSDISHSNEHGVVVIIVKFKKRAGCSEATRP